MIDTKKVGNAMKKSYFTNTIKSFIVTILILTLYGCSSSGTVAFKEYNNNDYQQTSYNENEEDTNESVASKIIKEGNIKSVSQNENQSFDMNEWDIENEEPLKYKLKFEGQNQSYIFTAPESGEYRFMLEIDNAKLSYNVKLLLAGENNKELYSSNNMNDFTKELDKGQNYILEINQSNGLPLCTIKVGIPRPTRKIEDNYISDSIEYTDQTDVYIYNAQKDGQYGFELNISDVKYKYEVSITNAQNKEIERKVCDLENSDHCFMNPELCQNSEYKISIKYTGEPIKEKLEYFIKIFEPNDIVELNSNVIDGNFNFSKQQDTFIFTPNKTCKYKVNVYDGNEPMEYDILFKDERNQKIASANNHSKLSNLELTANSKYYIVLTQKEEYGNYHFEIIEDIKLD